MMRLAPHPTDQRGFSLIEVLVAIMILMVGVLGVVAMVDGANAVTSKNKGREGATNVSRSIIEVARAVRYRDLSATELTAALEARPGLNDARPSEGHTIASRNFFYDVDLVVCSMDDPKDGLGTDDLAIGFCPESDHAASASSATDRNPDDYRRVTVTLTWDRGGGTETATQTSLVSNPVGGLGPSVATLEAVGFSGASSVTVNDSSDPTLEFLVRTSTDAAQVTWSVSGAPQGKADAIGTSERDFEFEWDIEGSSGGSYWVDCTYIVRAEPFDEEGRSGKPGALTVVLNRRQPLAPAFLEGGRNGNGDRVDLRWAPTPECDVLGYRVQRRVGSGAWEDVACYPATSPALTTTNNCLDEQAPAGGPLSYRVMGVDAGVHGAGDTIELSIVEGGSAPPAPASLSACLGGTSGCNGADGQPTSDGVTVLRWDAAVDPDGDAIRMYRIYRDGVTYAHRYGTFFPSATGDLAWVDPSSPDGSHTYRLTAVDANFRESPLSAPVTFPAP